MNHHAIDILARDRMNAFAREAAEARLAHGPEPGDVRESMQMRLLAGRLQPIVVRTAALVSDVRAHFARA